QRVLLQSKLEWSRGDLEGSVHTVERLITLFPNDPNSGDFHSVRGGLLDWLGRPQEAVEEAQRMITEERWGIDEASRWQLFLSLYLAGRLNDAEREARQMREGSQFRTQALFDVAAGRGDWDRADSLRHRPRLPLRGEIRAARQAMIDASDGAYGVFSGRTYR